VKVAEAGGTYYITCPLFLAPESKVPMVQGRTFQTAENGTVNPVQVREPYPKNPCWWGSTTESVAPAEANGAAGPPMVTSRCWADALTVAKPGPR